MADFDTCRNILYQKLATRACTPRIETDDTRTPINKHGVFYPAGTAEKVMSIENLEQLFTHVLASPACPNFSSTAMELARRVDLRKLQKFIAIMIVLNCDLKAMVSFTSHLVAPRTLSEDVRKNSTLPLENPTFAKSVLGNDATTNLFIEKQHEFLAPVIKKYKEVKGDFRRLPYVMEKLIGQGSFGTVYKVEISPHHFRDEDGLSNSGKLILARKDFVLTARDGAYDREREVLREIVRNVRNNSNIMESWGSLEFGTTYSLFMPLADCDLMKYMESRTQPQSFGEKAAFVKCAVDLSGAIDFLHEQLVSPNYEKLSCFHMDLKPQNILVVIRDGVHTWKLSDFNMSRVKGRKNAGLQPNRSPTFYEINKLFHQEKPIVPTSSLGDSTVNRRGTGTYLAPEACIGDSVQAESDIWSLGCVISVVFTYMCGGFSGVENFSKLRSSKSRDSTDCFFTLSRRRDLPKISDAVLNDGVARWLKQLRTTQPTDSEKAILEDLTRFLEKQVFVIDPARRKNTTADQIRLKLVAAFNGYRKIPEPRFEPTTSPRPRWKIFAKVNSSTISRPIRLDTNLDPPLVTCVLGSNACPLVCATSRKLKAFQVHHITSEAATDNLIESESVSPLNTTLSWSKHVAASIQYVIAATDNEEFEFYLYEIDQADFSLQTRAHWSLNRPKIRKLAISADGQHAAFIVQSDLQDMSAATLYIAQLDSLSDVRTDRMHSITSSSSGSSSDSGSPLGRPITLYCSAEDVCELTFSKSKILYVVSKPRDTRSIQENAMTVLAWNIIDGKRLVLQPVIISHKGTEDLSHGLFTTFAPRHNSPGFAVITEKTRIMTHTWSPNPATPSATGGYRILHIFWDKDDQTLLALGTEQTKSLVHLLAITNIAKRGDPKIQSLATFPDLRQESITSSMIATSIRTSTTQDCVLVTSIDAGTVRLFRVPLMLR